MRQRARPCPQHLRHRVVACPAGGWDLVTYYGYLLYHHAEQDVVLGYYARHCPQD